MAWEVKHNSDCDKHKKWESFLSFETFALLKGLSSVFWRCGHWETEEYLITEKRIISVTLAIRVALFELHFPRCVKKECISVTVSPSPSIWKIFINELYFNQGFYWVWSSKKIHKSRFKGLKTRQAFVSNCHCSNIKCDPPSFSFDVIWTGFGSIAAYFDDLSVNLFYYNFYFEMDSYTGNNRLRSDDLNFEI